MSTLLHSLADELERPLAASEVERGRIARQLREEAAKVERDGNGKITCIHCLKWSVSKSEPDFALKTREHTLVCQENPIVFAWQEVQKVADSALAERDALQAQVAEISQIADLYRYGNCEWETIKAKLDAVKYPAEPPGSIIYQILSVLCNTTIDLVQQCDARDALQAQHKAAMDYSEQVVAEWKAVQAKLAIAREAFEKLLGLGDFVEWRIAKEALEQLNKTQSDGKEK